MPVLTKINSNSIAEDAITGSKFAEGAWIENTTNQNISGTYSENRLYTSDAYTLSGNATINSHITLSTIKSSGDVVLTAGGAYTITGTGVLSGGSVVAKGASDLTGMTGTLGSVVTGSPAINLGNTTTQPGGVVQIVFGSAVVSSGHNSTNKGMGSNITNPRPTHNQGMSAGKQLFTPKYANSKILVQTNNIYMQETSNASDHFHIFLQDNTASTVLSHFAMYAPFGSVTYGNHGGVCSLNHVFDSWGTSERTLEFRIGTDGGGNSTSFQWNPYYNSGSRNTTETGQFHWTLTEIKI